jgi:pimeloyl-ACP methyl ester carboxylesterase
LSAGAVLGLAGLGFSWVESRMIYYPTRPLEALPSGRGWAYEDVELRTSDGVRIHGWFVPAPERAGPTLLLLHGNAGNISHRFEKLAILRDIGVDVLIIDYRGYGKSEGKPSERGLYRDAEAAYDYLTRQRGLDPDRVWLYGESLGSAVAVELAARRKVGGVILEAAFTSIGDVGQAMWPFLPMRWVLGQRFHSLGRIAKIQAPILLLHSRDDEYFPLSHAERLARAAGGRARLVTLQGGHNDAFLVSEPTYRSALREVMAAGAADTATAQPSRRGARHTSVR